MLSLFLSICLPASPLTPPHMLPGPWTPLNPGNKSLWLHASMISPLGWESEWSSLSFFFIFLCPPVFKHLSFRFVTDAGEVWDAACGKVCVCVCVRMWSAERERQRVAKLLKHKLRKAERLSSCVFSPNVSQMDFKVSDKSVSRLRVLLSLN